jgi:hypothetical protein
MAFSPTTNLSLPTIDTGTEASTWGEIVDNGLTSYVDIAIAGRLAITIVGADITLASTAGTSSTTNIVSTGATGSTAQYATLIISGAKTAARSLILPTTNSVGSPINGKSYNIINYGTGGYLLTVRGSATAGVTLLDSENAVVTWNGSDFVKVTSNLALAAYPVGSIYMSVVATNPSTLFGFGTWAAFSAGRVLVGFDSSNALFDTVEETGGTADATLVSHTHTATFTGTALGTHTHQVGSRDSTASDGAGNAQEFVNNFGTGGGTPATTSAISGGTPAGTVAVSTEGASATNVNYQPYITVYMWKRTA